MGAVPWCDVLVLKHQHTHLRIHEFLVAEDVGLVSALLTRYACSFVKGSPKKPLELIDEMDCNL